MPHQNKQAHSSTEAYKKMNRYNDENQFAKSCMKAADAKDKKSKRVSFHPKCRTRIYISSRRPLWYDEDDYDAFSDEADQIVDSLIAMNCGLDKSERKIDQDDQLLIMSMGLEHRLNPLLGESRRLRRESAFSAVWQEQARQYSESSFCDELLADVYQAQTMASQKEARKRALVSQALSIASCDEKQLSPVPCTFGHDRLSFTPSNNKRNFTAKSA